LEALVGCKALSSLSLANNKLANVDDLKAVAEELTLSVLELEANPLTENEDYHEKVMTMMPTLNVLDGRDEFGNEIEDDDEDDDEDEDDEDDEDEDEDDDEDDEDADEDEDEDESEEEEEEEEMGLADLYGDKPLEDDDDDDDAFVEDEDPESEDIDEEESDDDEDEAAAKKPKI
jgi:hypothetical protein